MIKPFAGPGSEFFDQSRFADYGDVKDEIGTKLAAQAMYNVSYVDAAKRAAEYQKAQARSAQRSSTAGSVIGAVASIGGALI